MATREVPREKNMGLKSTLVNVSKSIARRGMAKNTVLSPNEGKDRPEETPYLNTFHAVIGLSIQTY